MLPVEQIVGLLSTITAITTSAPEAKLHNHVRLCLDILYSTDLLEDANVQVTTGGRYAAEITSLLHKFRTRISSLLQCRTNQARWAAICLIKAGVETSPTFLQGTAVWIPMLLKLVNRPEHGLPLVERAIAVLTRIFVLTKSKSTLTRELTSPHLPTFSQYLLSPAVLSSDNLLAGLRSIYQILQTHPTTFRPQQQKTLDLTRSILFAEDDKNYPKQVLQSATDVYVSLVRCAQPKTQAEEWAKLFRDTLSVAEQTCDILFDCIREEKDSGRAPLQRRRTGPAEVCHLLSPERIGVHRMRTLLQVLQAFLSQPANFTPPIALPISPLISLLHRLFSIYPGTKPHPSAAVSTYQSLFAAYPNILKAAIPLISILATRIFSYSPSLALEFLHPVSFISLTWKGDTTIRTLCYTTLSYLLPLIGRTLSQKDAKPLLDVLSMACEDIIPPPAPVIIMKEPVGPSGSMLLTQPTSTGSTSTYRKRKAPTPQNKANTAAASSIHADQFLAPSSSHSAHGLGGDPCDAPLVKAAKLLATMALLNLQATSIPSEIRSRIERTMVLSAHAPGLLAAVLYPATKKRGSSLMPHLMAAYDTGATSGTVHIDDISEGIMEASMVHMAVEGLVYPRMQVIKPSGLDERGSSVAGSPVESRYPISPRAAIGIEGGEADYILPVSLEETIQPELDLPMDAPIDGENYPSPPPAPVPHHAKLPPSHGNGPLSAQPPAAPPPSAQQQQQPAGGMSPPLSVSPSLPRSNGAANGATNGTNGSNGGERNMFMPMAMPSPRGGVHAILPPSPLRQSMTIIDTDDDGNGEKFGREGKRVKFDDTVGDGEMSHSTGVSPIEALIGKIANGDDDDDDDDDDADIPEIVMGDSDGDEDEDEA
ncbi:hypothetical protein DRE_02918 [Drechslerella stenobrocha 248]|uniref:Pre-rRNA-processing protein RIX1 n=1 Tax=Drechslerella stenobrocha 248 TaxID=1043628 RepID=W7I6C2_9PEZI|nr:hypothetical protein DRE_02918 [Drechslerella stenobrocha 248]